MTNNFGRRKSDQASVMVLKWSSSAFQIMGYAATGFGWAPWHIYFFLAGLIGWFAVGVVWKDRAIMLIHFVALGALLVGLAS